LEGIEIRLKRVMQEHIKPAGYELQQIQRDVDRLKAEKGIIKKCRAGL